MTALRSGCYLEGHGDAFFPSQVSWSKVQVASLEHLLEGELLPCLLLPPETGESTVGSRVIHSNRSCRQIPSSVWHCSVLFSTFKEAHFWKREKYLSPFLPIPCPTSIFQATCACLCGAALCPHVHVGMCMCMYVHVHVHICAPSPPSPQLWEGLCLHPSLQSNLSVSSTDWDTHLNLLKIVEKGIKL